MRFIDTPLADAYLVELEPRRDDRGFFARAFCAQEFADYGLTTQVAQCNLSFSHSRGTLRGLHYQAPPASEAKLIRCLDGAAHMVFADVRTDLPTYLRHASIELGRQARTALFVPEGVAVGFQTLADDTELLYQVSAFYTPSAERGIRFDDPALGISWPLPVTEISPKDAAWPDLEVPAGSGRRS